MKVETLLLLTPSNVMRSFGHQSAHGSRSSAVQHAAAASSTRPNSWDFPDADGDRYTYSVWLIRNSHETKGK